LSDFRLGSVSVGYLSQFTLALGRVERAKHIRPEGHLVWSLIISRLCPDADCFADAFQIAFPTCRAGELIADLLCRGINAIVQIVALRRQHAQGLDQVLEGLIRHLCIYAAPALD